MVFRLDLTFLTPEAAAVGLLAAAPLAAAVVSARRAARVRRALALPPPPRLPAVLPVLALVVLGPLLGAAAAQPVLSSLDERPVRTDVEAFFLVDNSRSMLAAASRDSPTRFERARELVARLRAAIPAVPTGIGTLTDRAVPHVLPTSDVATFRSVLERSIAVDRPPPVAVGTRITSLDPLHDVGTTNIFRAETTRRLIVVVTDGETSEPNSFNIRRGIPYEAGYRVVFVHVWERGERIFGPGGGVEVEYRSDPASVGALARTARVLRGAAFAESDAGAAAAELRRLAGRGRATVRAEREERVALAPWLVGAALLPLGLVLVSRNRP